MSHPYKQNRDTRSLTALHPKRTNILRSTSEMRRAG
jgi:hypothetical protein